jgi:predicted nucleotidyltransferase
MKYEESLSVRHRLKQRKAAHLETLRRETSRIVEEAVRMGAKKVILFGSFSKGSAGIFSDLDLLIIMDSKLDFLKRTTEAYKRLRPKVGTDILVYTPDELKMMLKHKNEFIRRAVTEGQVLYET